MTFANQETSQASGDPVELYEFRVGTITTRLTSSEDPYVLGAATYQPATISRSRITVGPESRDEVIEIELPSTTEIVRQYINLPPGSRAELDITRIHRSDVDQQVATLFKGVVQSVGFSLLGRRARLGVAPLTEALSRTIPRFVFSGICNHVLYDGRCGVNSAQHRVQSTVDSVSSSDARLLTITGIVAAIGATSQGTGTASVAGGYVSLDGVNFRSIRRGIGSDQVELYIPFPDDVAGATVEVFAGCKHDPDDCQNVFANIEGQGSGGFGGFAFIPRENIFVKGVT